MPKYKPNSSETFDHEDIAAAIVRMSATYRAPYISIIGYSEALLEGLSGELKDAQREDVAFIRNSGWEALSHVNDVLDVMLLVSHEIEYDNDPLAIKTLIQDVMHDLKRSIVDAETKIQTAMGSDAEVMIKGDHGRLRQILLGLVQNALLSQADQRVQLKIEKNDMTVLIHIRDMCEVQNQDDYSYFFEPGWISKLANNRWRSMQWQSYLAHQFIKAHEGDIWVSPVEADEVYPAGTVVTIQLPLYTETKDA